MCKTAFIDDVTINMISQRCTRRSLPNYLVMTSNHWNVRQNILAWRWWMNDKITWRHARIVPTLFCLFHSMSINLGQFVFYCFSTFCQLNVFKYALLVWNLTKYVFRVSLIFHSPKMATCHLTPPSPDAFPHNASLYVIINYPDRWRYHLVTW